jgi:hypothetical protein
VVHFYLVERVRLQSAATRDRALALDETDSYVDYKDCRDNCGDCEGVFESRRGRRIAPRVCAPDEPVNQKDYWERPKQ